VSVSDVVGVCGVLGDVRVVGINDITIYATRPVVCRCTFDDIP